MVTAVAIHRQWTLAGHSTAPLTTIRITTIVTITISIWISVVISDSKTDIQSFTVIVLYPFTFISFVSVWSVQKSETASFFAAAAVAATFKIKTATLNHPIGRSLARYTVPTTMIC